MSRGSYSKAELERIREQNPITSVVGRHVIWDKKKSQPGKGDMWACCPFHGENSPSFHADDRKGIYHCFGCGATGDAFRFLQEKTGISFIEAVETLGGKRDVLQETPQARADRERADADRKAKAEAERQTEQSSIRDSARGIWKQTKALAGTLGEAYLRHRGIDFAIDFPSLRFHPNLRHPAGGSFPALVAGLQAPDGGFVAIWRIYLDSDGRKNTAVPDAKLGLGGYTESGAGVRLGNPIGRVNLCEGIETALGIVGITGGAPTMACLNTSGLINWQPPAGCTSALIWPDGDVDRYRSVNGAERKVESPGHRAANELAERMRAANFPITIQPTPKNGDDYLDVYTRMRKRLANG